MKPKTFNLALRQPKRDPSNAMRGFQRYSANRKAERKLDQEHHIQLQTLSTIGEDLPCCFVCSGRSQTWDGHPSCRGRRSSQEAGTP